MTFAERVEPAVEPALYRMSSPPVAERERERDSRGSDSSKVDDTLTLLTTILLSFSTLGTGLLSALLVIAVVQAPLVTISSGGTLEFEQTISASVSDWNTPQGRFFFAVRAARAVPAAVPPTAVPPCRANVRLLTERRSPAPMPAPLDVHLCSDAEPPHDAPLHAFSADHRRLPVAHRLAA
jgi:hypothetical protein